MAKPPRRIRRGESAKDVLLAVLWNIEKWEDREVCHLYVKEFTSRENSKFTARVVPAPTDEKVSGETMTG